MAETAIENDCECEVFIRDNDEDYSNNIHKWKLINADREVLGNARLKHRSGPDTTDHPVPGHYELYNVEYDEIVISSIPHLVGTKWGQDNPYNIYCPKIANPYYISYYLANPNDYDNLYNCQTGCVAVAGGQFLYYYHFLGDAGEGVFDSAYCRTFQYPFTDWTQMHQHNFSWSNWYKFNTADSLKMIAVLLANIGEEIHSMFGHSSYYWPEGGGWSAGPGTGATIQALDTCLNDVYDLDCEYHVFNDGSGTNYYDYIYDLLCYENPSIVGAFKVLPINDTVASHAFIVDRYKKGDAWRDNISINSSEWEHIQEIVISAGELDKYVPYDDLIYILSLYPQ